MDEQEKRCSKCKKDLPIGEFAFKNRAKGKHHSVCSACTSDYCHDWYETNKERIKAKTKTQRQVQRRLRIEFFRDYLSKHPCVDCGFMDIRALDFDHVCGKKSFSLGVALVTMIPMTRVREEIKKCEVRCKNCHSIRTNMANNSWRSRDYPPLKQPIKGDSNV